MEMKNIIIWIVTTIIMSSLALAGTFYPTPHYGSEMYSMVDNVNYDNIDSDGSFASFSEIQDHVLLNIVGTNSDIYAATYSGRTINFWGIYEGELVSRGSVTIGDSNDLIVGMAGKLNNPSMMGSISSGLIVLTKDTADNDIRAEELQFTNTLGEIDGYSVNDLFMLISDSDTTPETVLDCDYYPDGNGDLQGFCAYGSTTNKIVSFSTHEPSYNNIINLSDKSMDVYSSSNYNYYDNNDNFAPQTVIASHGTSSQIYFHNHAGAEITALDISGCTGGDCTLTNNSYTTFPTGTAWVHGLTGFDYYLYNNNAGADSGKLVCYQNYKEGSFNDERGQINCIYNNDLLFTVSDNQDLDYVTSTPNKPEGDGLIAYDMTNNGKMDICGSFKGSDDSVVFCVDTESQDTYSINGDYIVNGVGKIKGDDIPYLLLFDGTNVKAYNIHGNVTYTLTNLKQQAGITYLSDMDNDGNQEIIQISEGSVTIDYIANIEPQPFNYDDSLLYDGLYGFYNPAEVNTTQTIKAGECDYDLNNACSYTLNDTNTFNREKLCTTCGGTVTEKCGGWSYSEPSVTCEFNTTGTKTVNVDLYSEKTPDTKLGTLTINDWVINADTNNESNLVSPSDPDIETPTDDGDTKTGDEDPATYAGSLFDVIEDNIKSIVGIFFIIAVVASLASQGIRNHIVLMFAGILATLVVSILGLISISFLIYIMIAIIALIILNQTVFKSHGGE